MGVWEVVDDVDCVVPVLGGPHATGTTQIASVATKKGCDAGTTEGAVGLSDADVHNFAMHTLMHIAGSRHSCESLPIWKKAMKKLGKSCVGRLKGKLNINKNLWDIQEIKIFNFFERLY